MMHTEEHTQMADFLTTDEIDLLKRSMLKNFPEDEQESFIRTCQRMRLDPFTRQIYATTRYNKTAGGAKVPKLVIVTGILGMLTQADRTGAYDGCEVFWCGPDGHWVPDWITEEYPFAAKCVVYHKHRKYPEVGIARWDSYAGKAYNYEAKRWDVSEFWQRMPDLMLGKCAKALALRGAFPDHLSGVYAPEELDSSAAEPTDEERVTSIQKREREAKATLEKEPGVKIVASSGEGPTPAEALKPAFAEDEQPKPPPASPVPATAPVAKEEQVQEEAQDELDMSPPKAEAVNWKEHVVTGLKHKNYFNRKIKDLSPAEMAVIENQWLPAIKDKWKETNEAQRTDAAMFEAAIAHQKTVKPW